MVRCEVSSMTITGPEDFTYNLGEGLVMKGPFQVEVNQCGFVPTYAAEIRKNGAFVSAASNYDSTTQ